MNLIDLTVTQLKRAAAIKEQVEQLNKELASIRWYPNQIPDCIGDSSNYGRCCEKEDCSCSKSAVGENSWCEARNGVGQIYCAGQKEKYESSG